MKFTKVVLISLFVLSGESLLFGQTISSTLAGGAWDDVNTWVGGTVPVFNNSSLINVNGPVTVTITGYPVGTPLVIDQTSINSGGSVTVNSGAELSFNNSAVAPVNELTFVGTGFLDVFGNFRAVNGITYSGNTVANMRFQAGSTYEHQQTGAAVGPPAATYNATSTVKITGYAGNTNLSSVNWSQAFGNVVYDCPGQAAGSVDFGGHLNNILGDFTVVNTGTTGRVVMKSAVASTGTATMSIGGNLLVQGGIARFYLATTANTPILVTVGGSFTFNPAALSLSSQNVTTGISTLRVSGGIDMQAGIWNFSSGANGNGTIAVASGDFVVSGTTLTETGSGTSQGNIDFTGAAASQNMDIQVALGAGTVNLAIDKPNGTEVLNLADVTLAAVNMNTGDLNLNGTSVTISGAVAQGASSFFNSVGSASDLSFTGAGTFPANLNITAGSTFSVFQLNRSAQTLTTNSNFQTTELDLFAGILNNTGTITIDDGGLVDRRATSATLTGTLNNALVTQTPTGGYNVSYTATVAQTTGVELPTSSTGLLDLSKGGTNTLTLNSNLTINGNLTVSLGTLSDNNVARTISLVGDFSSGGTATSLGASSFTFAPGNGATASLSGGIAPTFGTLTFSDDAALATGFRINGASLTVDPGVSVSASAGSATFAGAVVVTNNGTLNLNAVTILANGTLTAPSTTMGVAGLFTVTNGTSTFNNGGGTIRFNGTSVIAGSGTKVFNNVIVDPGKSLAVVGAVSEGINGNLTNDGSVNFAAGGTLTFGGTTILSGAGTNAFSAVTISALSSLTSNSAFTVAAAFTNNGTFTSNAGFTASAAMSTSASGITIVNTAPFSVGGTLTVTTPATFTANAGANGTLAGALAVTGIGTYTTVATTTFSGTTAISGTGVKTLQDVLITGLSVTPNATLTVKGNIGLSNAAVLNAGNSTTTFSGTTAVTHSGSGTVAFNNIVINAGNSLTTTPAVTIGGTITINALSTITANGNLNINGATITNGGTLAAGATTTTTFGRAGTTTLTGGTNTFGNMTINAGATFTPNAAYTVNGNLVVNNVLTAGNNTATFPGTTTITSTGAPTISFNNINITGAVTSYSGVINVGGNFTNDGTFTANGGTVTFPGPAATHLVSSTNATVTTFANINAGNGAANPDVQFNSAAHLTGVLTLTANNTVVNSNGFLTLMSSLDNPATDATIALLPAGANVSNNVNIQRYISPEPAPGGPLGQQGIYRYLTAPVTGGTVAMWQNSFSITGNFTGHSTTDPSTGTNVVCGFTIQPTTASMFSHSETTQLYSAYPTVASSDPLVAGRGYAAFIRNCTTPVVTTVTGTINRGNVAPFSFTSLLTYNAAGPNPLNVGYNLVGNPFPSAIDWNAAAGWTPTNIATVIAVPDNAGGLGAFVYLDNTAAVPQYIASGQGFWVRTTAAAPALTASEAVKITAPGAYQFYRQATPAADNLVITATSSNNISDKAFVRMNPLAKSTLDDFDGPKLDNGLFDLSTLSSDSISMAVNAMDAITCGTVLRMKIKDFTAGTYNLSFEKNGQMSSFAMMLTDSYLNTNVDITQSPYYSFTVDANAGSKAAGRFKITFTEKTFPLDNAVDAHVNVCGSDVARIKVSNPISGVDYVASIGGHVVSDTISGGSSFLELSIPSSSLSIGNNPVMITAVGQCGSFNLNQSSVVQRDIIYSANAASVSNCKAAAVSLTASGAPVGGTYNWYSSTDSINAVFTGATFVTPILDKSKTYHVAVVNTVGCEGVRTPVLAEIINFDDAAIEQVDDHTLRSNYTTGNQWFLNGEQLSDTAMTLHATLPGLYELRVKIGNCSTSAEREMVVAGLESSRQVSGYPNPVTDVFYLELADAREQGPEVPVLNSIGIQIGVMRLTDEGNLKKGQFDFSQHTTGLYFMKVIAGGETRNLKIIKK